MKRQRKKKSVSKLPVALKDAAERKLYFGLLRSNAWVNDPLLSRWMRKAKKHGRNHTTNQIILESKRLGSISRQGMKYLVESSVFNQNETHCGHT